MNTIRTRLTRTARHPFRAAHRRGLQRTALRPDHQLARPTDPVPLVLLSTR
jgi:hypothetical protein